MKKKNEKMNEINAGNDAGNDAPSLPAVSHGMAAPRAVLEQF